MSLLYDSSGKRKYLTSKERCAFLCAARGSPPDVYAFCATLAYTGARISEVLGLVPERVDQPAGLVILECLKKRKGGVYRAVPMPDWLIEQLGRTKQIKPVASLRRPKKELVWSWCRTTAWKYVKQNMKAAGIQGPHACPKGLRHGFAVGALQAGVPLTLVSKWLGHRDLSTTAIYATPVGAEEQEFAEKAWKLMHS